MHPREPVHFQFSPPLLAVAQEIGELKRVRSANQAGTWAGRAFRTAWTALVNGRPVFDAMRDDVARGLLACRLGDLDRDTLVSLGTGHDTVDLIERRAFRSVAEPLAPALRDILSGALDRRLDSGTAAVAAPPFVDRLAQQPRAGVTCPGRPRLTLEPAENHAEHCWVVASVGVLLAPVFDADPTTVWLAALAHHLHNADLPDSGFTGEALLGDELDPIMARVTARALAELPPILAGAVVDARRILPDASTAEGRAFHAADTLDRVWQIAQHLRPGTLTLDHVLGPMALVHDGPVKTFGDTVLRAAGLPTGS